MSDTDGAGNLATFSVTELSGALKRTIEDRFGLVRVRGEVSGWRGPHASGHCYFSLKDQGARIDAVIWKGQYLRMKTRPEEGLEVIATGRITTFPGKSSYQIIVEAVEPAGVGALMALLEQRRRKLAAEGLFDAARKRPLPYLPAVIGVVTSPTGAVIRDILHRLADRFPRRVLVWPARVQGEGSADEIAAAIAGFGALAVDGEPPRPDVLIVARGGGSLEDLWGFNEEIVVRAVADCPIPVIAAVGHETDWTLIDHVADIRAPTPTAAAELAVPVRLELVARLDGLAQRQIEAANRLTTQGRREAAALWRALPTPDALLAGPRQRADRAADRLRAEIEGVTARKRERLARADATLQRHTPTRELAARRERLGQAAERLAAQAPQRRLELSRRDLVQRQRRLDELAAGAAAARVRETEAAGQRLGAAFAAATRLARRLRGEKLAQAGARLDRAYAAAAQARAARLGAAGQLMASLGYENVLARGYALVRDDKNRLVRKAGDVAIGQRLVLRFVDGTIGAQALGGAEAALPAPTASPAPRGPAAARRGPARRGAADQGDLF